MLSIFMFINFAQADEWESKVNGQKAYDQVQALLHYKKEQAAEVEKIFYGLRDKLYVVQPSSQTTYENNFLTPSTVKYTVNVSAKYNPVAVNLLYDSIQSAKFFKKGENTVQFQFPKGNLTINLYDEIFPTYQDLVQGGYAFEARAVLLDTDQTVIATSDNSLLLSVPFTGEGLNFKESPQLRSYVKAEPPDITTIVGNQDDSAKEALKELQSFFSEPAYRLINSNTADFYSLPVDDLKKVSSCRVLRESDELLVYKRDAK